MNTTLSVIRFNQNQFHLLSNCRVWKRNNHLSQLALPMALCMGIQFCYLDAPQRVSSMRRGNTFLLLLLMANKAMEWRGFCYGCGQVSLSSFSSLLYLGVREALAAPRFPIDSSERQSFPVSMISLEHCFSSPGLKFRRETREERSRTEHEDAVCIYYKKREEGTWEVVFLAVYTSVVQCLAFLRLPGLPKCLMNYLFKIEIG